MRRRRRFKTARCVLQYRDEFLLAVHSSFWLKRHRRWGLPGGSVEWGEDPHDAARRELEEELSIYLSVLTPVGHFAYKGADHMVYTATIDERITDYDEGELLDLGWFTYSEIERMEAAKELHAGYELLAVQQALASSS